MRRILSTFSVSAWGIMVFYFLLRNWQDYQIFEQGPRPNFGMGSGYGYPHLIYYCGCFAAGYEWDGIIFDYVYAMTYSVAVGMTWGLVRHPKEVHELWQLFHQKIPEMWCIVVLWSRRAMELIAAPFKLPEV